MADRMDIPAEQQDLFDESEAWKAVMRTPDGQHAVAMLVKRYGWTTQTLWNSDAGRMAMNEGQRMVCVHIGRMISLDFDKTIEMTAARGEEE